MFLEDKLIVSTKKLQPVSPSLEIGLKPSLGRKFEPFGPKDDLDPALTSVSILNAIAAIPQIIKSLKGEKEPKKSNPPIQLLQQIRTSFLTNDSQGRNMENKAVITLKFK